MSEIASADFVSRAMTGGGVIARHAVRGNLGGAELVPDHVWFFVALGGNIIILRGSVRSIEG